VPSVASPWLPERISSRREGTDRKTLELDEVLLDVTRGLVEGIDVALARVWLVDAADGALHLPASSGSVRAE
jgi:hypothetical protein